MANPVLSTRGLFTPSQPGYEAPGQVVNDRMTFDDVLAKTAISLGGLFLVAAFAYYLIPPQFLYPVGIIGGLVAFIVPFVVIRSRAASPVGNIAYAVAEGLLLAAFSKIFEQYYPGIIVQAVLGTFMAAAITLIAYRYGGFRISSKGSRILRLGMFAFVGVALLNLVLFFFGINLGLFPGPGEPVSILAWVFALVGVALAVYSLVDDFQYIEAGVNAGAPRSQGWLAAFGLSVTMVWLYVNILRILSYFRN